MCLVCAWEGIERYIFVSDLFPYLQTRLSNFLVRHTWNSARIRMFFLNPSVRCKTTERFSLFEIDKGDFMQ